MTISDTELEAGLRDLRSRVDHLAPVPVDLARLRQLAPSLPRGSLEKTRPLALYKLVR